MSDKSVLSTLHKGGEGQNVYRMNFSKLDQGCSLSHLYSEENCCQIGKKNRKKPHNAVKYLGMNTSVE